MMNDYEKLKRVLKGAKGWDDRKGRELYGWVEADDMPIIVGFDKKKNKEIEELWLHFNFVAGDDKCGITFGFDAETKELKWAEFGIEWADDDDYD